MKLTRARSGAVAVLVCFAAAPAHAAPGDLDPSFGGGTGWARTPQVRPENQNYFPDRATGLAVQPDGKIVAVCALSDGGSQQYFGAFRYLPDGELDSSFGMGGFVAVDVGRFEESKAVALQPDGKIVVAGDSVAYDIINGPSGTTVVRFNPDGSVDKSFGSDGVAHVDRTSTNAVAVQPDGRIVLAGSRSVHPDDPQDQAGVSVQRLLPDGRLDPSFSHDGKASFDYGYGNDRAEAIVLQRGRLVVGGLGQSDSFGVARFRPDGRVDRSFGNRGRRVVSFGREPFAEAHAVTTTPGGGLLVAGIVAKDAYHPDFAAVRLTPDGALDRRFGKRGHVRTAPGPYGGSAYAVGRSGRGGMLVAGDALNDGTRTSSSTWALVRYTDGGRRDRSFGEDGIVRTRFGTGTDTAGALAVVPGKAIVAGEIYGHLGVARYLTK